MERNTFYGEFLGFPIGHEEGKQVESCVLVVTWIVRRFRVDLLFRVDIVMDDNERFHESNDRGPMLVDGFKIHTGPRFRGLGTNFAYERGRKYFVRTKRSGWFVPLRNESRRPENAMFPL